MRLLREVPPRPRWGFLFAIAGLALAAIIQALLPSRWQLFCPWRHWAGIPCPSCGATRCVAALLHGSVLDAFLHQPLFFLIACSVGVTWLWHGAALIFRFPIYRLQFESRCERFCAAGVGLALVGVNWLYVLACYSV